MKLIKLNESQYKRLFEADETLLGLGDSDESQNPLPHNIGQSQVSNAGSEISDEDDGHKFQKPFGGITRGKETDGKFVGKDLGDVVSRPSTFNMGGVRGGTGGF